MNEIDELREELRKERKSYESATSRAHRLARLVDQCRHALEAVKRGHPLAMDFVDDRLSRIDDYLHSNPERKWTPER